MSGRCLGAAVAAAVVLAAGLPARAQQDPDTFKARIEGWLTHLGAGTNGALHWAGSDPIAVRAEGEALVAAIEHGRLATSAGEISLGRIEIRETRPAADAKTVALAIALPDTASFKQPDGAETRLTLDGGKADAVLDADWRHLQQEQLGFKHARIEQPKTGASLDAGPLSLTWKLAAAADGSWKAPLDFELTGISFQLAQIAGGGIDRIAYHGAAVGPKLAAFEKLRDTVAGLQTGDEKARQQGLAALVAVLPDLPGTFSTISGTGSVEGLKVVNDKGEMLVALPKLTGQSEVSGLDGSTAALRFGIRYDGLKIAPNVVPATAQPHRLVVDLGIADLDMATVRDVLTAAAKAAPNGTPPASADPMVTAQLLGAATRLTPSLHIYDAAVDTDDVGLDLTGATKGSPLSPQGYEARAELSVRGLDAVPKLGLPALADMLPLLKQLGEPDPASGKVVFHLASTMQQRVTVNGHDVSGWFADVPGGLRPNWPPTAGEDVKRVQRALDLPPSGVYDGATAAAVARYQKQNGLNESGVVDAATRAKLGLPPPEPRN